MVIDEEEKESTGQSFKPIIEKEIGHSRQVSNTKVDLQNELFSIYDEVLNIDARLVMTP